MNNDKNDFGQRVAALDLSLFDKVPTQSHDNDRRAWLAIQRSIRSGSEGYTYLEIGSHLGGSIQQHLPDPLCRRIISIDKRPSSQPDARGKWKHYEDNSTDRMLSSLRAVDSDGLKKIICFDADAITIDPSQIPEAPRFCLIDGEHTKSAVISDFQFVYRVSAPNAAICFHDDWIIFPALARIVSFLKRSGVDFTARKLGGDTFGIFLRNCPALNDEFIRRTSRDGIEWLRRQRWKRFVNSLSLNGIRRLVRSVFYRWRMP